MAKSTHLPDAFKRIQCFLEWIHPNIVNKIFKNFYFFSILNNPFVVISDIQLCAFVHRVHQDKFLAGGFWVKGAACVSAPMGLSQEGRVLESQGIGLVPWLL